MLSVKDAAIRCLVHAVDALAAERFCPQLAPACQLWLFTERDLVVDARRCFSTTLTPTVTPLAALRPTNETTQRRKRLTSKIRGVSEVQWRFCRA